MVVLSEVSVGYLWDWYVTLTLLGWGPYHLTVSLIDFGASELIGNVNSLQLHLLSECIVLLLLEQFFQLFMLLLNFPLTLFLGRYNFVNATKLSQILNWNFDDLLIIYLWVINGIQGHQNLFMEALIFWSYIEEADEHLLQEPLHWWDNLISICMLCTLQILVVVEVVTQNNVVGYE